MGLSSWGYLSMYYKPLVTSDLWPPHSRVISSDPAACSLRQAVIGWMWRVMWMWRCPVGAVSSSRRRSDLGCSSAYGKTGNRDASAEPQQQHAPQGWGWGWRVNRCHRNGHVWYRYCSQLKWQPLAVDASILTAVQCNAATTRAGTLSIHQYKWLCWRIEFIEWTLGQRKGQWLNHVCPSTR